ncbi:MAG: 3,4-dihydroxy-2-butanone-4-phosphate synthase [Solirubrobacteraceae bacterium]
MSANGPVSIIPPERVAAVDAAADSLATGGMAIVTGPAGDGHEGVFVQAAQHVTAEDLRFLGATAGGLTTVAVPAERLADLRIRAMADRAEADDLGTPTMHVGVNHRSRSTGGVSFRDRAATVRALADSSSVAGDFVQPGHVFPLAYTAGGVLRRPGHTEAALDLVRIAGLGDAAALCDIARADGEMADFDELADLAATHGIPLVRTADVVLHRLRHEASVERVAEAVLPLPQGTFVAVGYRERDSAREHMALVLGSVHGAGDVAVHLHAECLWGDVFRSNACGCAADLDAAMAHVSSLGRGVIVYLAAPEARAPSAAMGHRPGELDDEVGAQILRDLGVVSARGLVSLSDPGVRTHHG